VVTHPDHIAHTIRLAKVEKRVKELNDKYDDAVQAAQDLLSGIVIVVFITSSK